MSQFLEWKWFSTHRQTGDRVYFEEILCDEVVLSDEEKAIVDECGDLDLVKLA